MPAANLRATSSGACMSSPQASGKPRRRGAGITTKAGYANRNGQEVIRPTGNPGTDHGQYVYVLRCRACGHEYGANGSRHMLATVPGTRPRSTGPSILNDDYALRTYDDDIPHARFPLYCLVPVSMGIHFSRRATHNSYVGAKSVGAASNAPSEIATSPSQTPNSGDPHDGQEMPRDGRRLPV